MLNEPKHDYFQVFLQFKDSSYFLYLLSSYFLSTYFVNIHLTISNDPFASFKFPCRYLPPSYPSFKTLFLIYRTSSSSSFELKWCYDDYNYNSYHMVYGYCNNCFKEHVAHDKNFPPYGPCSFCGKPNGVRYAF